MAAAGGGFGAPFGSGTERLLKIVRALFYSLATVSVILVAASPVIAKKYHVGWGVAAFMVGVGTLRGLYRIARTEDERR